MDEYIPLGDTLYFEIYIILMKELAIQKAFYGNAIAALVLLIITS